MDKKDFYIIGLTGGVGCGKTRVAGIVAERFPAEVIFTDDVAREQMRAGGISYKRVVELLGDKILAPSGEIDRGILAELMFADTSLRNRINELTHPPVHEYVMDRINTFREDDRTSYVIIETALLIEAGYTTFCDAVWYVYAPEADRRRRLCETRGYSDLKTENIINAQKAETEFRKIATYVIDNGDGVSEDEIYKQICSGIMQLKAKN